MDIPNKGKEPAATHSTLTAVIEKGRKYDPKSLPAKVLESPGFRALISKLNPRSQYKLPLQKYFTQHEIPNLYTSVKDSTVKPKLAEIEFFAVATNLWTSGATHPYLSCPVHFIDHSWELQSLCMCSNYKMLYNLSSHVATHTSHCFCFKCCHFTELS